jgi:hypothetical protein
VGKHCSNLQCFKEKKNYKSKFSTNSILKKNQQKRFWKKKTQKNEKNEDNFAEKNGKKNMWRKLKLNSQPDQY